MASAMTSFTTLHLHIRNRIRSVNYTYCIPWIPTANHGYHSSTRQYLHTIDMINRRKLAHRSLNMDMKAINNSPRALPPPSGSPSRGWSIWLLLPIIPVLIPVLTGNWGSYMKFEKKMDTALQNAEELTEAIEDVAEAVDKIADEVTDKLPQHSKLRKIIKKIDKVAEETIIVADSTKEILNKVEDVEKKIEAITEESTKQQAGEAYKQVPKKKNPIEKQVSVDEPTAKANLRLG